MPRYFFNACNGEGFVLDEEGVELADLPAARKFAIDNARSMMAGDVQDGRLDLSSFIEVEDESRELLFTLSFAEAVDVTPRHYARKKRAQQS